MNRRDAIRMSDEELAAFLEEERVVSCASIGPDGWPHVMPLWYIVRDDRIWIWTYAASQKVRNLERDPRATLLVETGDRYEELRGAMFRSHAIFERDVASVATLGLALYTRYHDEVSDAVRESVERQARKRVGIGFALSSPATWDHRKLTT
jgi:Pyridoxamine 5'-phosphate oxidase